ncbi:Aldo/keto reductase [Infundibulicybe gibba]|nr:Aldo/keto reductase [Infundibulicybe gibba]
MSAPPADSIRLNDGNLIPILAFGTGSVWKRKDVTEYVEQALEIGFSHLDMAQIYANEESAGVAIRESGLQRSELFVTTKYDRGSIPTAVRDSLSKLGLKQLDLYLIHFPGAVSGGLENAWMEFEKIKEEGISRSIGVSNFKLEDLQALCKTAKIMPAVNQIQLDPYNYAENRSLLEYCANRNIVIEAYSVLSPITKYPGGPVDKPVLAAAEKRGVQPSQILLAWVRAKGVVVVTTSSNKEHLKQYLASTNI